MDHKNANNVTDEELYNGFVWVQQDGQAVSMYYGKKIVWGVVTGVEEVQKMSLYTRVCYAILAATYSDEDLYQLQIEPVKISVQPDGVKPFLIKAECSNTDHAIIEKLKEHHKRTRKINGG